MVYIKLPLSNILCSLYLLIAFIVHNSFFGYVVLPET
jgi:hypothetical protein